MNIRDIKTEKDLDWSLSEVDALLACKRLSKAEASRLNVLVTLIEAYEDKHHPIPDADPVEVIRFLMQVKNLKQKDLIPAFGSKARVSEVLNKKRPLNLEMARNVSEMLHVPLTALVQRYDLVA